MIIDDTCIRLLNLDVEVLNVGQVHDYIHKFLHTKYCKHETAQITEIQKTSYVLHVKSIIKCF